MMTNHHQEWTGEWEWKVRRGTGTQIDPQTEELGNKYMDTK